jgi:hypothetical protein
MGEGQDQAGTGRGPESPAEAARPTEPQRRYLARGLSEPGGKLPIFNPDGRQVPRKTIEACIAHGWAEPWFRNPIKADWRCASSPPRATGCWAANPRMPR